MDQNRATASRQRLVLGQRAVEAESNEIQAIPPLLASRALSGALVSIDAIGCQKTIAKQIVGQGGDYLLAVKANQPALLEESLCSSASRPRFKKNRARGRATAS